MSDHSDVARLIALVLELSERVLRLESRLSSGEESSIVDDAIGFEIDGPEDGDEELEEFSDPIEAFMARDREWSVPAVRYTGHFCR